jgi:thioredoxin 2
MDKITVVCPHCHKTNAIPKKESYTKANCGHCKQSLLDTAPIELTSSNFDHFIANNEILTIVDFWAPWCGPCKMMAPTFTSVAKNFPLNASFVKVNTENEQLLGGKFNIRSIPTLVLFKNNREIHRVSGALDAQSLNALVKRFI